MARPVLLADQNLRDRLLDKIRAGLGRHEAARIVGVSSRAYSNYVTRNPEFAKEVEEAVNASIEPVTKMLRTKAINEEDVSAAKEYRNYIEREAPAKTQQQTTVNVLNLGAVADGQIEAVVSLQQQLADRRAAALEAGEDEIIDLNDSEVQEVPVQE